MKKATIHFEYADSADLALSRLKALPLQNLKITPMVRRTDDLPAQYPVKPKEIYGNHTAYLNGLPHITEGVRFTTHFSSRRKTAALFYNSAHRTNRFCGRRFPSRCRPAAMIFL